MLTDGDGVGVTIKQSTALGCVLLPQSLLLVNDGNATHSKKEK